MVSRITPNTLAPLALLCQRLTFKSDPAPARLHKVTDILVVCTLRIFQHIRPVEIPEQRQPFLFIQPFQLCKTENLARAVVFPRFIHRIAVGKFCGCEMVMLVDVGDDVFKVYSFGEGFELG